jgi:glutamate-1-semialdehyde 2,1-aminomutase
MPPNLVVSVSGKSVPYLDGLQEALQAAKTRYVDKNQRSQELHQLAAQSLPGGNTRTTLFTTPFPMFMKSGKGYQVISEDGQT